MDISKNKYDLGVTFCKFLINTQTWEYTLSTIRSRWSNYLHYLGFNSPHKQ